MRSAVGVGTWIAPGRAGRAFGIGSALATPDAALVRRLLGVRDSLSRKRSGIQIRRFGDTF